MSSTLPARSGVLIETMTAPYGIVRTSTPDALLSVKRSTALPSGSVPNDARATLALAFAAISVSELDPDGFPPPHATPTPAMAAIARNDFTGPYSITPAGV